MKSEVHFTGIKKIIQSEISKAKESIFVAVAWFTDDELFSDLVEYSKNGIQIQLIINSDDINKQSGLNYFELYQNGGVVFLIDSTERLMHNKFCIIDKQTILNGSYNWTRKAHKNLENITIIKDLEVCNVFIDEFEKLKINSINIKDSKLNNFKIYKFSTEVDGLTYEELLKRAKNRIDNKNYLASLNDYNKAIELKPDKYNLLFNIAYCEHELGDNFAAIKNYSKYITYFPNSSAAYNNLGNIHFNEKKFDLAIDAYNKAIELDNNDAVYFNNRAEAYKGILQEIKKLEKEKSDLWEKYNKSKYVTYEMIEMMDKNINSLKNKIKLAEHDYLRVLQLDSESNEIDIYENIAEIFYEISEYKNAIYYYNEIIKLDDKNHYAYYCRGWTNYILDNLSNAVSDINIALKIKPYFKDYTNAINIIKKEKWKIKNWLK